MSKYIILEYGEYDDYKVKIIELLPQVPLTTKEILFLLDLDSWSKHRVAGYINGAVTGWRYLNLIEEVESSINGVFCCFDNRKYKTVLDKKYTQDELLEIATTNDKSGVDYWVKEIDKRYSDYLKAYALYRKLTAPNQH